MDDKGGSVRFFFSSFFLPGEPSHARVLAYEGALRGQLPSLVVSRHVKRAAGARASLQREERELEPAGVITAVGSRKNKQRRGA